MADTRKDKRAPVSLKVRFKSATVDEFVEHYCRDISRGGLFIKSKDPMPIGTLLKFELQLKDESRLIHGVGRVVWRRLPGDSDQDEPPGMGIKFIRMDASSRSLVETMIRTRGEAQGSYEKGADASTSTVPTDTESTEPPAGMPFFPTTTKPEQMPAPEDRTQVRDASEFLASALSEGDAQAAAEAEVNAERARRRTAEIERERASAAEAARMARNSRVPRPSVRTEHTTSKASDTAAGDDREELKRRAMAVKERYRTGSEPPGRDASSQRPTSPPPPGGESLGYPRATLAAFPPPPASGSGRPRRQTSSYPPPSIAPAASTRPPSGPPPPSGNGGTRRPSSEPPTRPGISNPPIAAAPFDLQRTRSATPSQGFPRQITSRPPPPSSQPANGASPRIAPAQKRPSPAPAAVARAHGPAPTAPRTSSNGLPITLGLLGVAGIVTAVVMVSGEPDRFRDETEAAAETQPRRARSGESKPAATPETPQAEEPAAAGVPALPGQPPGAKVEEPGEPAPEPVALPVSVRVESIPQGAMILVDGEERGATPNDVAIPREKEVLLTVKLPGYAEVWRSLRGSEGLSPIRVRLERLPYVIEVETEPPDARVSAAGQVLQSPGMVRLTRIASSVRISVSKTGYKRVTRSVRVEDFSEEEGALRYRLALILEPGTASTRRRPSPESAPPRDGDASPTPEARREPVQEPRPRAEEPPAEAPEQLPRPPEAAPAEPPKPEQPPKPEPPPAKAIPDNPFG